MQVSFTFRKDTVVRKIGITLAVLAFALGFGIAAQAGGKGAVKTDLWEAEPDGRGFPQPTDDADSVGFVVFNTSKKSINVTVVVKNGEPNMSWDVRLVPTNAQPAWSATGTLTTNGRGKGTLHLTEDIPDTWQSDFIRAKISMYPNTGSVYYATYMQTEIPVK